MTSIVGASVKLSQIIGDALYIPPEWDRDVAHLVTDSRDVQQGDLFIARAGQSQHGSAYVDAAIRAGAAAVIEEGATPFRCEAGGVPVFGIESVSKHLVSWLQSRYPMALEARLIGVTGTNGKSSVTQYVAQLLQAMGERCAVIGTLGNGIWPELAPTRNTSPDICITYRLLHDMQAQGARYAALEVSSHALDQGRVDGLTFAVSVLTNITQDHLDYHGTMEDYFTAKAKLFRGDRTAAAVINLDDEWGQRLWGYPGRPVNAVGLSLNNDGQHEDRQADADMVCHSLHSTAQGMSAVLDSRWGRAQLTLPLAGSFNVANTAAAISALVILGFDFDAVTQATSTLRPVAGRMELYVCSGRPAAVVDYAHTPDALENVVAALQSEDTPVTLVFGCGGDRDRAKRPLMADAASVADQVWVSDDNPRSEDPEQIFEDIRQSQYAGEFEFMHDRAAAIKAALAATPAEGILLIAGKGHEDYMEIHGERLAYSDEAVLLSLGYQKSGGQHAA